MNNLTTIEPTEYGLSTEKAKNITLRFSPKELEFNALIQRYNEVITMDVNEALNDALALKKDYLSIEKIINEIHKAEKDFYLNGGRFVDAQKNRFKVHIDEHKKKLDGIIKYKELQEKTKQKALSDARHLELGKYMNETSHIDLGSMQEEVYVSFLSQKKKDLEDSETLKQSNEIIGKIYQSETFEEFNQELFGSHIEERKKQLLSERLLKIANYNSGDLGFELDSTELQEAFNNRSLILDSIRVERIKAEMQTLYQQGVSNILNYIEPIFDAQEFTEEWKLLLQELKQLKSNRINEISNIISKLNDVQVVDSSINLSNGVTFCLDYELTEKSIEDFNLQQRKIKDATLTEQQLFENWINSFVAPESINDNRCKEVIKKFEAFKKWAVTVK